MCYKKKLLFAVFGFLLTFLFQSSLFSGEGGRIMIDIPPPRPPATNPHPPVTELDKKRVEFAQKSIFALLAKPISNSLQMKTIDQPLPFTFIEKDLNCFQNIICYEKDTAFVNKLILLHQQHGEVAEIKHAHLIPWSVQKFNSSKKGDSVEGKSKRVAEPMPQAPQLQPDEYMVHVYAKFSKTGEWYHLDVIMTEDKDTNLYLKHFFATPILYDDSKLPPGVKC